MRVVMIMVGCLSIFAVLAASSEDVRKSCSTDDLDILFDNLEDLSKSLENSHDDPKYAFGASFYRIIIGTISRSQEFKNIQMRGVNILPALEERIYKAKKTGKITPYYVYYWLFIEISRIEPYVYCKTQYTINGKSYMDKDLEKLPFLTDERLVDEPSTDEMCMPLLAFWHKMQDFDKYETLHDDLQKLLLSFGNQSQKFSWEEFRSYSRDFYNYGVFLLPALIKEVRNSDNMLAFYEFVRISRCTLPKRIKFSHDEIERIESAIELYSDKEEHLEIINTWWEMDCENYKKVLPKLAEEIEKALK